MPRRRVLTEAQLETLFALPTTEADLALHWTLSPADHAAIQGRRGDHNRLGFTLQLCALRYPGRLLRPGETIPHPALNHLASQLNVDPGALAAYAARFQTRYEQLDDLRRLFGFTTPERSQWRELLDWMLPVALATTRAPAIAPALMDEIRRRQFIAPGSSVIERMVAAAVLMAERRVASQLTGEVCPPPRRRRSRRCCRPRRARRRACWPGLASRLERQATARSRASLTNWSACVGSASIRSLPQACIPNDCASWPARAGASLQPICVHWRRSVGGPPWSPPYSTPSLG